MAKLLFQALAHAPLQAPAAAIDDPATATRKCSTFRRGQPRVVGVGIRTNQQLTTHPPKNNPRGSPRCQAVVIVLGRLKGCGFSAGNSADDISGKALGFGSARRPAWTAGTFADYLKTSIALSMVLCEMLSRWGKIRKNCQASEQANWTPCIGPTHAQEPTRYRQAISLLRGKHRIAHMAFARCGDI